MNSYILLGTTILLAKKYKTPAKFWQVVPVKPAMFRYTLLGAADVTYGPGDYVEWQGQIEGTLSPDTVNGYGTLAELRAILKTKGEVSYQDHYGTAYQVHLMGPFPECSLHPVWSDPSNKIYIQVRIVKAS
jgi:hypothetical protein